MKPLTRTVRTPSALVNPWFVGLCLAALFGCGDDESVVLPSQSAGPGGGDGGGASGMGGTAGGEVAAHVTPASVELLTCSAPFEFTATVEGAEPGASWAVSGPGTISSAGLYQPGIEAGSATITATSVAEPAATADAYVDLRTAIPGPQSEILEDFILYDSPFDPSPLAPAVRGDRVYRALAGRGADEGMLFLGRSDDGGATWSTAPIPSPLPRVEIGPAVAVDSVDPDLVYVAYRLDYGRSELTTVEDLAAGAGGGGESLLLAISTDGGSQWTTKLLFSSIESPCQGLDVVVPAPQVVVVSCPSEGLAPKDGKPRTLDLYIDADAGHGFGSGSADAEAYYDDGFVNSANGLDAGRLVTNGQGSLCVVFDADGESAIACSADHGASFGAPVVIADDTSAEVAIGGNGDIVALVDDSKKWIDGKIGVKKSVDGGATFVDLDVISQPSHDVLSPTMVGFAGEVLWIAYRGSDHAPFSGDTEYIDKSCDGGATWSGYLPILDYDSHLYKAPSFFTDAKDRMKVFAGGTHLVENDVDDPALIFALEP
jgi:hypothetical protein